MFALIQRVKSAQVTVESNIVGSIGYGALVFLGVQKTDTEQNASRLAERVLGYRIFPDAQDQMNLSVVEKHGGILVVSQFTLAADTNSGMRPSFTPAALPDVALPLYAFFVDQIKKSGISVATGEFGAKMEVALVNDGPVTFLLKV